MKDVFVLPVIIDKDSEYIEKFKERVNEFVGYIDSLSNEPRLKNVISKTDIDNCKKDIKKISKQIIKIFNCQLNGHNEEGIKKIKKLVKDYEDRLIRPIIKSYSFFGRTNLSKEDIPDMPLYLYKGRINKLEPYKSYSFDEMFHIPFNKRHLIETQRYSIPGVPCVYLAQNSYVCWKELKMPTFEKLSISAVKIDNPELKMIDLAYQYDIIKTFEGVVNFTKVFNMFKAKLKAKLDEIVLFPLEIAISIKCKEEGRVFKSEYVIPQLLMHCLNDKVIGIAYHSNEISTKDDLYATNLAIPVINYNEGEQYGCIKTDIKITDAINFGYFNNIYNKNEVLSKKICFAKGIEKDKAFNDIKEPLSSFNKVLDEEQKKPNSINKNWSYDGDLEYKDTPFYKLDDFILYAKEFKTIEE